MKRCSKLIKFIVVLSVIMVIFYTVGFAASIGQPLTSPEAGWKRSTFDQFIKYNGVWGYWDIDGIHEGAYTITGGTSFEFSFYGTKFRLLGIMNTDRPNDTFTVKVDGIDVGTFNPYLSSGGAWTALQFEKTNLIASEHHVQVTCPSSIAFTNKSYLIEAIDIDETGYFVDINAPTNLTATSGNAMTNLSWNDIPNITNYNIKRSTTPGGPYDTINTSTTNSYTDTLVTNGTKYYYTVTSVVFGTESSNSNEALAIPEAPAIIGNPAILEITMITQEIKEYDLTAAELQKFLTWYDSKSDGTGKAYYIFDEKNNIKPFLSRKEYISYDKISSFEVNEYTE